MDSRQPQTQNQDVFGEISSIHRMLRTIEDKLDNLRKKVQVVEQNMLESDKKLFSEVRMSGSDIIELKHELEDFKDKMKLIVKEIKLTATKEELEVLKKYLSYFEPINFVTKNDLRREIDDSLRERAK